MHLNQPWWIDVIKAFVVINLVMGAFAYLTLVERKLLGRMHLRYGPNRVGPFGLLQPIADLVKLLRKASFEPAAAIDILYFAAPAVAGFTALAAFSVIPFGGIWHWGPYDVTGWVVDVSIGLVLVFALGAIGIYAFVVAGWSSESKYSLLGSMRTCAQLVSYEVSFGLAVLGVVLMGQSLSLVEIVEKQNETIWFAIPQIVGLLVFFVAGVAETNRAPFDLPEAEQELVAGYHTEYSGFRFGMYYIAEYVNVLTVSAIAATLFFGGWTGPFNVAPGPWWLLLKMTVFAFVFVWLRATLPRLRYDQLMRLSWGVLLPLGLLNVVVTAVLVVALAGGR